LKRNRKKGRTRKRVDTCDWHTKSVEDHGIQNGEKITVSLENIDICTAEVSLIDETIEFNIKRFIR
jgi:pheromone shutdown protein TraB